MAKIVTCAATGEGTYKEQGRLIEGIKTSFVISDKQIKPLPKGKLSPV